ncbi:hypothetical protein SUGI_0109450 [Cryptomeria japonica]|uniref:protein CELLULOSE SYNTHASE INTERACTIVE 1 isoform X2 n=1 Tax=Cryptomeria japonica TaxID=3369 RepID=UPI002408CD14|nr:protein CELLULOSE SYNTHASE INTERACTIVE 1 isoform X2 [Cryptomeria japonica]XP_057862379.2 protein CELLULOSE SYNTHASE INTERACTIVE 1 isoform X2 [Cryptomeria japonica]XP_057862380.2 protein CELLULOSE SYNTHASE INTERACTIVE 1 isoform X2 [Cryptomeria japonica]GLJ09423.1 hypothetical protein SUGI_0109450 [Cryptomeria japonica]
MPIKNQNGVGLEDPDGIWANVAQFIEQLRTSSSTTHEKELITQRLLNIAKSGKDARIAICSHSQAIPLLVALLKSGTSTAKINVASILGVLCQEEELRIKVLLGGCIPPLLGLLKLGSVEAQKAAGEAIYAVSYGSLTDHVGSKIFVTEGVVTCLWDQLGMNCNQDKFVDGLLTGALKNLCNNTEGFWKVTIEVGGVEILVRLLFSGNPVAQANASFLLANLILGSETSSVLVDEAGAVKSLLKLLDSKNETSVRAEAVGALQALTSKLKSARKSLEDAGGIPLLIGAIAAPSKESLYGESAQALQENAMKALANILGSMSSVVCSLGETIRSGSNGIQLVDTIGALAYVLMMFSDSDSEDSINVVELEGLLITQLKPDVPRLVQKHAIEALAGLYGNVYFHRHLYHAEAKKLLIGLLIGASIEVRRELTHSLKILCTTSSDIWQSLRGREGVQLLISLLSLSSRQQQEHAVALLSIISLEADEGKWAITAAGGIPPLVQLLETGSVKAKEDAALVLRNLICHSRDIRACVQSAEAVPAFLCLLKDSSTKGQEIASEALRQLIEDSNPNTFSQLRSLLSGDHPELKVHILDVLGHMLSLASLEDLVSDGAAANKSLHVVLNLLGSANLDIQEKAASVLADVFDVHKGISASLDKLEIIGPLISLLHSGTERIAIQSARALAALFVSIETNKQMSFLAKDAIIPLFNLTKSPSISAVEMGIAALANLLLDGQIANEAIADDVIPPLTRVLMEGTLRGKQQAADALARLICHGPVDHVFIEAIHRFGTVLHLVSFLSNTNLKDKIKEKVLEALSLLCKEQHGGAVNHPLWEVLVEAPNCLQPLVTCLEVGIPPVQEKAIEILSKLCRVTPVVLGDMVTKASSCINGLCDCILHSSSLEVKVGGTAVLICAAKQHKQKTMEALNGSGNFRELVHCLVDMLKISADISDCEFVKTEENRKYNSQERLMELDGEAKVEPLSDLDPQSVTAANFALWLLSIFASHDDACKIAIMEAGTVEILTHKLSSYSSNSCQAQVEVNEGIWVGALLLALLFQDRKVIETAATMRAIASLTHLLSSEEVINKYFAAQALASLVCNGKKGTLLAVANSGAAGSLIPFLGTMDSDIANLEMLSDEFSLVHHPDQVVLEQLFQVDEIRVNATARKSIPALVELLRPMPDRPGAPPLALNILSQIAISSDANKLAMADAGALEAITRYISLGPQDSIEEAGTELLRILFENYELRHHEAAKGAASQLVAVLRLGSRGARYNATRALEEILDAKKIKSSDTSKKAVKPLVEILITGSEKEQEAAINALIKLSFENPARALAIADDENNPVECLRKILSTSCSLRLKESAAQLFCVLFRNSTVETTSVASNCIESLVELLKTDHIAVQQAGACALDKLLDDKQQAECVVACGAVIPLVQLVSSTSYPLLEAAISALIKLAKDHSLCKIDMVKAGVIDYALEVMPVVPDSLCALISELFRILTTTSSIAKAAVASRLVEPLFIALTHPELSTWGQNSALQAIVNILKKHQGSLDLKLTPNQAIEPLVMLLESPSQTVQQHGAELLSHLLAHEYFQRDTLTQHAVVPLVRLAGIGIQSLQEKSIKALENASISWPNAIAEAGGIMELSKVILQVDPRPPHSLWESAASVISNVLRFSSQYYFKVPLSVLVELLRSSSETTVAVALKALVVLEKDDASSAEMMAEAGIVKSLLGLLRCHQCEEVASGLLEALFNNSKVREMKVAKHAISPLSQYLLDPQTRAQPARLLAALALGDLFQHDGLARTSDSVSACRALVSLLEDQPTEDMQMVAICALQNLVAHSRTNRRAVAEAGGIQVVQELLTSNNSEISAQAALLIKLLFSSHVLKEYVSSEILHSLTVVLEKELWATATVNEDVVRAIYAIFSNFSRLRETEVATLCIPHLVGALQAGIESTQEAALDALCLLKHSWASSPVDVGKAQAMAAAEAIPILQLLVKSGLPRFQEKAESLLQYLPGTLTVTIKRGNNLKQAMASTNAYCKLTFGNGPPRETKVVNQNTSPEWKQGFAWAFDMPPKGQKLIISCKSKNTFGKVALGKVAIQIDRVVMLGTISGQYTLIPDSNRDGTSRTLEIEFQWSNR